MIESEGITEEVESWRTDVVAEIARELGLEKVMFGAADPEVFGWYVKNYGPEGQPVRRPLPDRPARVPAPRDLGTKSLWGRVLTYQPDADTEGGPR